MLLGFPLTYLIIPRPTNKNIAAAAAMLSNHPGKGYLKLVFIMAGLTMHIGKFPLLFFKIL